MELLHDEHLLDRILDDFETCGIVGERTGKLVGYLAATSRLLDKPLGLVIQSSSSCRQKLAGRMRYSASCQRKQRFSLQRHDQPEPVLSRQRESQAQDSLGCRGGRRSRCHVSTEAAADPKADSRWSPPARNPAPVAPRRSARRSKDQSPYAHYHGFVDRRPGTTQSLSGRGVDESASTDRGDPCPAAVRPTRSRASRSSSAASDLSSCIRTHSGCFGASA